MGISCGATLIKYLLFFFNLLWLVLGGVVIWLGVSISSWSSNVDTLLDVNMKAGSIPILVTGVAIFLLAFLGCCGAIKENSCMLSTYGGVILILVVVQCVGVYFAFKYKTKVDEKIYEKINEQVKNFRGQHSKEANRLIQEIQKTFKCCGAKSSDDYNVKDQTPSSCCGKTEFNGQFDDVCGAADKIEYTEGCGEKVKNTLNNYLGGLGGVAIALILIQLLIILSACCLSREVRN